MVQRKRAKTYSENVLSTYFDEKSTEYKSSSLWAQYSMIRSCIQVHDNIDISKYAKQRALLYRKSDGYVAKKSKVFTDSQIETFLSEADDNEYLLMKVKLC